MPRNHELFQKGYRDRDSLKRLWTEAFGDADAYVDFLFQTGYLNDGNINVLTSDGKLLSALAAVPLQYSGGQAAYLCYAATFRAYRGLGLMGRLIRHTVSDGGVYTLIPSSEPLFGYYAKLGFRPDLYAYRNAFMGDSGRSVRIERVSHTALALPMLYPAYQKKYAVEGSFYKSLSLFRSAVAEANFDKASGGFFTGGGTCGFVAIRGGHALIREWYGGNIAAFAQGVRLKFGKPVFLEDNVGKANTEKIKTGMILGGPGWKAGYLNQMLN